MGFVSEEAFVYLMDIENPGRLSGVHQPAEAFKTNMV